LKTITALFAVAVLVAVSACGGSDEEALTKAEFVKEANAICVSATKERTKILNELVKQVDPNQNLQAQQEQALKMVLPTYEGAAEKIDELGAPEGDEQKVDAIVVAMEGAADQARANPQTVVVSGIPFKEANELAAKYGLDACVI